MGFTPYHTHALLPQAAELPDIAAQLAVQLGGAARVRQRADRTELLFGEYPFFLFLDTRADASPDVFEQVASVLKAIGTPDEQANGSSQLLSYGGVDPDPDMDHFNDYVFLSEAIQTLFPGVVLYDPQTGRRI